MEESSRRQNSVLDQHEGRFAIRLCRLWEGWKDPANGEWLHTCTIITGEPNEFVRQIHTRMPVILQEEHREVWLSGEAGKEVLVPSTEMAGEYRYFKQSPLYDEQPCDQYR
jgi:putative SOS response-associated peptidase YedK